MRADESRRVWIVTTLLLTIGTAVSAILAAVTLETLMHRPSGGGSMTTMLSGAVYAMATVMKVCLVSGGVAALIAVSRWIASGPRPEARTHGRPAWGLSAIALVVSTPWIGAVGSVVAQAFAGTGPDLSVGDLPQVSRVAVFVQLAVLLAGAVSAAVSLKKNERPRLVALLGLATSVVLMVLFWHFQFYAPGFNQDTWVLQ